MREILSELEKWTEQKKPIAIAANVRVHGSSLRPLGAKMAVTSSGDIAGSVSGGCIEGAVYEQARAVIQQGSPKLLHFGVSDETRPWDIGLTCGTSLEVLVESLAHPAWQAIYSDLIACLEQSKMCAVVTVFAGPHLGSKMLITSDGILAGSLGAGALDLESNEWAQEQMRKQKCAWKEMEGAEVFVDVLPPPLRLVIIGAVHVAIPLVKMAKVMGFTTIVIDPRKAFADRTRFPNVDKLITEWPSEVLPDLHLDESTYLVALSHDDKLDNPALALALTSNARYVGVLGARTNIPKRLDALREMSVSEQQLAQLHAPVGLSIGADLPEEIAISILAEIVAARYGRS